MNNPPLNDTDYDYFRTAEEKKAAEPINHKTDTYKVDGFDIWRPVELYTQTFNLRTDIIYRRRKPSSLQYPRWVKCSERLPDDASLRDYFAACALPEIIRQLKIHSDGKHEFHVVAYEIADCLMQERKKNLNPIPPPPKVEEKKDEFEEWFEKDSKENGLRVWSYEETCKRAWHAALSSKESKKGDK